ncbi:MAG: symmetrical bis(5'-nucleosyl)-tetraphosphatase [Pigmentiphaga sp.]
MQPLAHTWAIGDLQGCCAALDLLLAHSELRDERNRFWFVGDLVNRGPQSLATLRRVRELGERAITVLGNHDLHLLGIAAGARHMKEGDTLRDILEAPDAADWIDWLRHQPLAHQENGHLLVHAGVLPAWTADDAEALAREVEGVLRGPDWQAFMHAMYGNQPDHWRDDWQGVDRWRVIVNALTRLRFCTAEGAMDFEVKESASAAPPGLLPWFEAPDRRSASTTVVFGHWSTLGLLDQPNLLALDTGCVWGGSLTAVRLNDRHRVAIDCGGLEGRLSPG